VAKDRKQSIQAHLGDADEKMVFDKFHVAKHLGEAVDKVRQTEHKQLRTKGDQRLKGTKYTARGFRNFDNFKNAIYFHCGDLDLSPQPT